MFKFTVSGSSLLIAGVFLLSLQGASGFDDKQHRESSVNPQTLLAENKAGFVENKGQIVDQNNTPNPAVRFLLNSGGLNVQLRSNGFSYDTYKDELTGEKPSKSEGMLSATSPLLHRRKSAPAPAIRTYHRVDVELVGANSAPLIKPLNPQLAIRNYYTRTVDVTGVRSFEKVVYAEIYPHIDLEFFLTETGSPEYQFVVHPGGDPDAIRLRYTGANSTRLVNGAVELAVAHGTVREHIPLSYLVGSKREIAVSYKQTGMNEYGCAAPTYASSETLVIDPAPVLNWGTYYGGGSAETGNGIACDVSGNVYVTGYSWSDDLATTGAYQTTNAGNQDAYLVKFSSAGVRLWGTFYGGSDTEEGLDVACDAGGNVYVTGFSWSNNGISTAGAHQSAFGGNQDAFLVKFSGAGARQWATYYGGTEYDLGYSVACDAGGDVVVTGQTSSPNAIASAGAHQTAYGGAQDGFIARFSGAGVRLWGTYYGGNDDDRGYDVATDASGNVIVAGFTNSPNAIASAGAHQTTSPNGYDAFFVKFSGTGTRQWGTYYGGIDVDEGHGIACDAAGNVYATGITRSTNAIATAGAFQTAFGGVWDAFLVKFSGAGARQWGTYYGGSDYDACADVVLDAAGNPCIAGYAASASGIATIGAHKTTNPGGFDALIAKFSSAGARQWGTYYGGNDDDFGLGIARDPNANLYITGLTLSSDGIATAGAFDEIRSGEDAFIASFSETDFTNSYVLWLQGASVTGKTDGQTLETWSDDANADDNATQTTASARPTYRSSGTWTINGQPSVQFGTGKGMGIAARDALNGGSEKTIFAVFKTGTNTLNRQVLVDIGGLGSGFNMYVANNNVYAGAWDNQNTWLSRQVSPNTVYLAQFVYNGSALKLSAHAAPNGTGSATATDFNDNFITGSAQGNGIGSATQQTRYHNGINVTSGLSDPFLGAIAEVIVMNSADAAERTQVWSYLNQKYAVGMSGQPITKYAVMEEFEPAAEGEISVYPNPSADETVLSYFVPAESPVRLLLQNVLGETVAVLEDDVQNAGEHQVVFSAGHLPAGMYRAVLLTPTGSVTTQVVIQR